MSGVCDAVGIVDRYDLAREDRRASRKTGSGVQQVGSGGSLDGVVKDLSVRVF